MQSVGHVPELVGIPYDIDRDNATILNLQRGGLENVASFDSDEPWQAIDRAIAHEARLPLGIDGREPREQAHDLIEPCGRRFSSRRLAAAVRIEGDVRREQRAQALHLATP